MKKIPLVFVALCALVAVPLQSFGTCPSCDGDYAPQLVSTAGVVDKILETDLGNDLAAHIEDSGGAIDVSAAKTLALPAADIILVPAGSADGKKLDLLYLDVHTKGEFLFVVESSIDPFDISASSAKLYTPSGSIISYRDFELSLDSGGPAFQEYDDLSNSVSFSDIITYADQTLCIIAIVLCLFVWILFCIAIIFYCF